MEDNVVLTEAVYYILLTLTKARHGYGIMQMAEELSGGRVRLAAGTLYGALNSLCKKGWIEALPELDGSRKKEYQITADGYEVLQRELARLRQLVANGELVLGKEAFTEGVEVVEKTEALGKAEVSEKTEIAGGAGNGEENNQEMVLGMGF